MKTSKTLKLKKQHELFSECRRNFDNTNIRKMKTVEIPSKKDKLLVRAKRRAFDRQYLM